MEAVPVELDPDLIDLLEELGRPAKEAARELIVLGLYGPLERQGGGAARTATGRLHPLRLSKRDPLLSDDG